ncbi:hypothetical protein [Stieleria varia]|uniref:hypothetical protein n=1 Tax=Stieleria varia TaxID=2528005 RepID=UPI001E5864C3|nr:hypothetical protein [Stieleria varia]
MKQRLLTSPRSQSKTIAVGRDSAPTVSSTPTDPKGGRRGLHRIPAKKACMPQKAR